MRKDNEIAEAWDDQSNGSEGDGEDDKTSGDAFWSPTSLTPVTASSTDSRTEPGIEANPGTQPAPFDPERLSSSLRRLQPVYSSSSSTLLSSPPTPSHARAPPSSSTIPDELAPQPKSQLPKSAACMPDRTIDTDNTINATNALDARGLNTRTTNTASKRKRKRQPTPPPGTLSVGPSDPTRAVDPACAVDPVHVVNSSFVSETTGKGGGGVRKARGKRGRRGKKRSEASAPGAASHREQEGPIVDSGPSAQTTKKARRGAKAPHEQPSNAGSSARRRREGHQRDAEGTDGFDKPHKRTFFSRGVAAQIISVDGLGDVSYRVQRGAYTGAPLRALKKGDVWTLDELNEAGFSVFPWDGR